MKVDASLLEIQRYILFIQSVFFTLERFQYLNLLKLDVDSEVYDQKYEKNVRRQWFSLLTILDEILQFLKTNSSSAILADELENTLFKPHFLHELIFGRLSYPLGRHLFTLCRHIENEARIVAKDITERDYQKIISNLGYLSPPETKDIFINELERLKKFLKSKGNIYNQRWPYENSIQKKLAINNN